jgi:hypothetical protein
MSNESLKAFDPQAVQAGSLDVAPVAKPAERKFQAPPAPPKEPLERIALVLERWFAKDHPKGNCSVMRTIDLEEYAERLNQVEQFVDEQKAKPGAKDPIRSALHAHLDEVLDWSDSFKSLNRFADKRQDPNPLPGQIHKFFRELMK